MKNYKMTNPLPMQSAGMGAIAGAATTAVTPGSAIVGGLIGAGVGAVAGGIMKMRDEKATRHSALNETQFGKK
jgi:outer membrane lipoprotein SlyB